MIVRKSMHFSIYIMHIIREPKGKIGMANMFLALEANDVKKNARKRIASTLPHLVFEQKLNKTSLVFQENQKCDVETRSSSISSKKIRQYYC